MPYKKGEIDDTKWNKESVMWAGENQRRTRESETLHTELTHRDESYIANARVSLRFQVLVLLQPGIKQRSKVEDLTYKKNQTSTNTYLATSMNKNGRYNHTKKRCRAFGRVIDVVKAGVL